MMTQKRYHTHLVLATISLMIGLMACEKDITIDVPEPELQLVVEGKIESGTLPLVLITRSSAYFSESSGSDLYDFVHDAEVTISSEGNTTILTEVCASSIPDSLLPLFSELIGVVISPESTFDYCVYTDIGFGLLGEDGKTYNLEIKAEGKTLTASTTIPIAVELDSVWFEVQGNLDSLGWAWARLTDPDTVGNAYRWYAQRINHYDDGTIKDPVYIAPFNSAVDDRFFNGLSFDFTSARGTLPYSDKPDDENEEANFFKVGDTIAVKGCSIDYETYLFVSSFYLELGNQGSPFSAPASLKSNIEGGLGVWAGYAIDYDTIIATY